MEVMDGGDGWSKQNVSWTMSTYHARPEGVEVAIVGERRWEGGKAGGRRRGRRGGRALALRGRLGHGTRMVRDMKKRKMVYIMTRPGSRTIIAMRPTTLSKPLLFAPRAAAAKSSRGTPGKSRGRFTRGSSVAPDPSPQKSVGNDAARRAPEVCGAQGSRRSSSFYSRSDLTPSHISTEPMYPM